MTTHLRAASRRGVLMAVGAVLAMTAGLTACSDSGDDATTSPTSPSSSSSEAGDPGATADDVCAAAAAAQSSLDDLLATSVVEEGTDTVKERFGALESDVTALLDAARAELAPQSAAVRAALSDLKDLLSRLQQDPTAADAALLRPALQAVGASTEELLGAAEDMC